MAKRQTKKKKDKQTSGMSKAGKIVILLVFIVLFFFSLFKVGQFGLIVNNIFCFLFGKVYFILGCTLIYELIKTLFLKETEFPKTITVGLVILNLAVMMLGGLLAYKDLADIDLSLFMGIIEKYRFILEYSADFGGGLLGTLIYVLAYSLFDKTGALITLIVLFVISAILIIPLTYFIRAAKKSKDVVTSTAASLEEARNNRIEKAKQEKARIEKQKEDEKLASLTQKRTIQDFTNKNEGVEEVENVSEFSHDYFIEADGITMNKVSKAYQDYKSEMPHVETNIQTTLQDSSEPKLTTGRTLQRESNFKNYKLPTSKNNLLAQATSSLTDKNEVSAKIRGKKLIEILSDFGIKATLMGTYIGPSVTKFEIKPDARVNINKISSIQDNIKMELAAQDIRIEAPIPGKNAVGVEVPNAENVMVKMSELIYKIPVEKKTSKLLFALGKDLSGDPVYCELDKMPHLLIAGATGSGKSVCINTIITSYLLRSKPDEVKLVLVDPKKVEFTPYHDIPHLLWPVITDAKMASLMLKKIVVLMEERYDAFAKAAVRDIKTYNAKVEEHNKSNEEKMNKFPYIVVIIDELADLMSVANKEVQDSIQRITQLARASGIHLIVATQRPSTDVITGLIKSNIPSRISFAVSSSIDSRTILDTTGAERLLGNGDMLYSPQGSNSPIRLQGCYVSDKEIIKVTDYCKSQAKPEYDDSYFALQNTNSSSSNGTNAAEDDGLYQEVVQFIAQTKKASTSSLQRRFGIGYNRAARLIDTMEENGLIGPANGSKPREVYIKEKEEE